VIESGHEEEGVDGPLLWIVAAILVIAGVVSRPRAQSGPGSGSLSSVCSPDRTV